ncbi:hypothetical protein U1Q18_016208 [Sarracenia purpurea var. burkii]
MAAWVMMANAYGKPKSLCKPCVAHDVVQQPFADAAQQALLLLSFSVKRMTMFLRTISSLLYNSVSNGAGTQKPIANSFSLFFNDADWLSPRCLHTTLSDAVRLPGLSSGYSLVNRNGAIAGYDDGFSVETGSVGGHKLIYGRGRNLVETGHDDGFAVKTDSNGSNKLYI